MSETGAEPPPVGKQLAERREELNLSQAALAALIGVTSTSVSAAENGRSSIQRGKRSAWEEALRIRPGSISRAYNRGTLLEPIEDGPGLPFADLGDSYERTIWEMDLPEAQRRILIELLRSDRRDRSSRPA